MRRSLLILLLLLLLVVVVLGALQDEALAKRHAGGKKRKNKTKKKAAKKKKKKSKTTPPASHPVAHTPSPTHGTTKAPTTANLSSTFTNVTISPTVTVVIPPQVCRPENCPPGLGDCVDNVCVYKNGYQGLKSLPQAYVTNYCTLTEDGCKGVTYINTPHTTATIVGANFNLPLCQDLSGGSTQPCVGIAASPPILVGNSQEAIDPSTGTYVKQWGMGLTEASGICYRLTGPGPEHRVVLVALTDRCGGYCTCEALASKSECGPCVNKDLTPGCPCVGTVGDVYSSCCGLASYGCPSLDAECDWCASQNHPHFDLDTAAFSAVCASSAGQGSCELSKVEPVTCLDASVLANWPPGSGGDGGGGDGGGGGTTCGANSFWCDTTPNAEFQPQIDGCTCCCNWGMQPVGDGGCACA